MKIKIDDSYYITSDSYNPAILVKFGINKENGKVVEPVSYTHLTLPTTAIVCRSRWSPYH